MHPAALILSAFVQPALAPPPATVHDTSTPAVSAIEFLVGTWDTRFAIVPPEGKAVYAAGTVETTRGGNGGWLEMTATTDIPGVGPYRAHVVVYPSWDGTRYHGFVRTNIGGAGEYTGGLVNDSTLVLEGIMDGTPQRVTYRQHGDLIDFLVEDSHDGGASYTRSTEARWERRPALPTGSRVGHFEIPADHPERAAAFYREALDWTVTRWDGPLPYWEITTGAAGADGIDGGLLPRDGEARQPVLVAYVASIDRTLAAIRAAGGAVVINKEAVPGVGWQAYFRDTEGNYLAVFQMDPAAR